MGAIYAARAGYDPRAAITFWQKMTARKQAKADEGRAGGGKLDALLSTHPADEKRIADLRALMPQVVPIFDQHRVPPGDGKFKRLTTKRRTVFEPWAS